VRQDALTIAWRIMTDDRGPAEKAGVRPWTFGITKKVAANDRPASLVDEVLEKNPEHAENIRIAQEQPEGNLRIMDVAKARGVTPEAMRKSISRSRLHVQTIVVAA